MFFIYINSNHFRTLYELATKNEVFYGKSPSQIYNLIRSDDFEFFNENQPTDNEDFNKLISLSTNRDASLRPTAIELSEQIKMINFQL